MKNYWGLLTGDDGVVLVGFYCFTSFTEWLTGGGSSYDSLSIPLVLQLKFKIKQTEWIGNWGVRVSLP